MIRRLLAAVMALLVVCLALFVWQLSQGPLSLGFATPYLEEAVHGDDGEWRLQVGDLVLMRDFKLHARDVNLLAADGAPLLHVPDVIVRPSLTALTHGVVAVSVVEINDAEAHILRRADGSFGVSVAGASEQPSASGEAGAGLLEDLLQPVREDNAIGYLRHFNVTNAKLSIQDVETGAAWTVADANISLRRGSESHDLTVKATLHGEKVDALAAGLEAQFEVRPSGEGFILDGNARASGIDMSRLGLYWPQNAAVPARRWVTRNVDKGRVSTAAINLALSSASGTDFRLTRLDGTASYEGLSVRWNDDAPAVKDVVGTMTFNSSSMRFHVVGGVASELRVRSARIALLDLDTDRESISIEVKGQGPVSGVIGLIPGDAVKLPFEARGDVDLDVQTTFPLSSKLTFAAVDLKVDADPRSVRIRHASGEATVAGDVRYQKRPRREPALMTVLDVTAARFEAEGFRWELPAGKLGKVTIGVSLDDGPLTLEPLHVDCPGLRVDGGVVMGKEGTDSGTAQLRNLVHAGTDLNRVEIEWTPRRLKVHLGDGTIDLEPLMAKGDDKGDAAGDEPGFDLDIATGDLRRVSFDADSWIENVRVTVERRNDTWERIELRGELPKSLWSDRIKQSGQRTFALHLKPTGPGWRLDADASDFGSLLRAFDVSEGVSGGVLEVSGRADRAAIGMVLRSNVEVRDFVVLDAPVMLRVLTVASLDRFVATLRGGGLHFDAAKGTVIVGDDRYTIKKLRAHGSSLGWTADGWIDRSDDKIHVEGAVIPADQANKIIGKIPLLGDLLLGMDRRGLIAINYKVRGDLKAPKVTTNPLSALTPGFLREVWEIGK